MTTKALQATAKTSQIDPAQTAEHIGLWGTRGGQVILDEYFNVEGSTEAELAKFIYVGNAGNVILEDMEGRPVYFSNLPSAKELVFKCKRVLSAATVSGNPVTTTATNLTWVGGI